MNILAIEASGMVAGCSIINDGKVISSVMLNGKLEHAKTLMKLIDQCIKNSSISINDINYIAVSKGPGSFTGLRIAMSTAKGIARGIGAEIIGVSTLESLAYNMNSNQYIVPIIDARREQVYMAMYKWDSGELNEIIAPNILSVDDLIVVLKKYNDILFLGDGIEKYKSKISSNIESFNIALPHLSIQNAESTAIAAYYKLIKGDDYDDNIMYLIKSQAERERENVGI